MSTAGRYKLEVHILSQRGARTTDCRPSALRRLLTTLAAAGWFAFTPAISCAQPPSSDADVVSARAIQFRPTLTGYGHIAPLAPLWLRVRLDATVGSIDVHPGQSIHAGTALFQLTGPGVEARLDTARAAVRTAKRRLRLTADSAKSARRRYPEFTDRTSLDQSLELEAQAQGRLDQARTRLRRLLAWTQVKSPIAGHIADVTITPGETLQTGTRALRIQPSQGLWLKARFFPRAGDTLFVGERGMFHSLSGEQRKVRIAALAPSLTASGARLAWLAPIGTVSHSSWAEGARGSIELFGPAQTAVQVPPAALVLDRAHWWVVLREDGKLLTRAVDPAPGGGTSGVILKGLKPGALVVVRGSYRLFHRNVASHYTPPD